MKKNMYKYAAMAVIAETLIDKCKSLRDEVKRSTEYYNGNYDVIPEYGQADIDKNAAIADFIEDFISKL